MSLLHHLTIMRRAKGSGDLFPSIGQQANAAPMGSHEYPIGGSLWSRLTKRSPLVQTYETHPSVGKIGQACTLYILPMYTFEMKVLF